MSIADRIISRITRRSPDFVIGGEADPYMRRWWIIPRNRFFNVYLHEILRDDDDRALHDHPYPNCSIVLRGGYIEVAFAGKPLAGAALPHTTPRFRDPGAIVFRRACKAHRLICRRDPDSLAELPSWSLFITGPRLREWGFWCPQGRWVHWQDFTAGPNGEVVGKGCET